MFISFKHISRPCRNFAFRYTIPLDLRAFFGIREFKKTIRTDKSEIAAIKAKQYYLYLKSFLSGLRKVARDMGMSNPPDLIKNIILNYVRQQLLESVRQVR